MMFILFWAKNNWNPSRNLKSILIILFCTSFKWLPTCKTLFSPFYSWVSCQVIMPWAPQSHLFSITGWWVGETVSCHLREAIVPPNPPPDQSPPTPPPGRSNYDTSSFTAWQLWCAARPAWSVTKNRSAGLISHPWVHPMLLNTGRAFPRFAPAIVQCTVLLFSGFGGSALRGITQRTLSCLYREQ